MLDKFILVSIYGMVKYGKSTNNYLMASKQLQTGEYTKERKQLGQAIKRLRNENKMTQEDLAFNINVNVSYLAKIENGYVNTSVRYLIKIAQGLRTKVKDLFDF